MKKNVSVFVSVFVFLLIFSCENKPKNIKVISLKHAKTNVSLDDISDPRYMLMAGENEVIIRNGSFDSLWYSLANLNTGKKYKFGLKGRGPGEIIFSSSPFYNSNKNLFYTYSGMNKEYVYFRLKDVKKGKVQFDNKLFSINKNDGSDGSPSLIVPVGDSLFVASGMFQTGRFGLYNNKGVLLNTFGEFPENENNKEVKKMTNMERSKAYSGILTSCPEKNMFVAAVRNSDLIEIYQKKDNEFIRINKGYKPEYPPCVKVIHMGEAWSTASCRNSILGFRRCAVSDRYIFISFSSRTKKDFFEGKANYPHIIRVYNLKGKRIVDLDMDMPIWSFTVDSKKNKHIIYAIVPNNNMKSPRKLVKYEVKL